MLGKGFFHPPFEDPTPDSCFHTVRKCACLIKCGFGLTVMDIVLIYGISILWKRH